MKSFFSENLKTLRKYKKITLEELSEAINVSKSAISDYENDKFSPSIFICRKIADYFNVSVDFLEYSEIMEINANGELVLKNLDSLLKHQFEAKEWIEVLGKQKNELATELKLQKQKVEGLQVQFRLQEQLKESKLSEIELLKTQIGLLEDKILIISL
jgi:transcriptional regulator with XRE-family HTH domain